MLVKFRAFLIVAAALVCQAQDTTGIIKGKVTLAATGDPLHHATVLAIPLGRSVETGNDGIFQIRNVPPGKYTVVAHMHSLTDERKSVTVSAGGAVSVDFALKLGAVKQEVTVSASLHEETTLETFNSVTSVDSLDLTKRQGSSLGDILENETGVAKRSGGPGTTRPVLRGFDGDRVMVLQDGMPTGTLSSQSGDHGEPVNPYALERVEVIRGPATLLYGNNAIGGVVSMVTGHHQIHQHPHEGLRGYVTATGGTNNSLGGATGGVEYGLKNWLIYGDGGGQRTGDYHTPMERIFNSGTHVNNGLGGVAHYTDRLYWNLSYNGQNGSYGVPASDDVHLDFRRHDLRFTGGLKQLPGFLDNITLAVNYSDWNHREVERTQVGTEFFNKQFSTRGVFEQKRSGRLSGQFGFWVLHRDYKTVGEEAIAPPTKQNALAGFAVEQIGFDKFHIQLGARVENNRYDPQGLGKRSFTGLSAAAGINRSLWNGGVFVANYSHSFRAPALEELYNYGPHRGNFTWEIGNANLFRERSEGIDLSLRHQTRRANAEVNYFFYRLTDYVYLAPTGNVRDDLIEADYAQAPARYQGIEGKLSLSLTQDLWFNLGADSVFANLRDSVKTPLPRIPPVRGRIGLDYHWKDFGFAPEFVLANRQTRVFPTETETAGYGVLNLRATYTHATKHVLHFFALNLFNTTDQLYRNHLSFIKEFAPEIGRGVQLSYSMRFF